LTIGITDEDRPRRSRSDRHCPSGRTVSASRRKSRYNWDCGPIFGRGPPSSLARSLLFVTNQAASPITCWVARTPKTKSSAKTGMVPGGPPGPRRTWVVSLAVATKTVLDEIALPPPKPDSPQSVSGILPEDTFMVDRRASRAIQSGPFFSLMVDRRRAARAISTRESALSEGPV